MTIDQILLPADVNLALRAGDKAAALEEVLGMVRGDGRVVNWERLRDAVIDRDAPALEQDGRGICIAHGRTDAVRALTVAVGRSAVGFPCPGSSAPVHLFFVAGIPAAMNSEYLRLVGAIVRVCRVRAAMDDLLDAPDGEAFVGILSRATDRL